MLPQQLESSLQLLLSLLCELSIIITAAEHIYLLLLEWDNIKAELGFFLTGVCRVDFAPDLSEPVHARAVIGGLVPQSPARPGSAVAAGHRLPDGPSAEAAGFKQWLPALSGHHLW